MKKILILMVLVLTVVYIALSILGSKSDYAAEKLFYRAMKMNEKIIVNPDVAPPVLLASVERELKSVIKRYPKAAITKTANIALLEFYINHKKYDEAVSLANNILITYEGDLVVLSTAQFLKGVLYEKQNRWDKALSEFKTLERKYPNTKLGIQIPLYIGRYYALKGDEAGADKSYREAVAFYQKLEREHQGTILGYTASTLLIRTYINLRDYKEAGTLLEATLTKYASPLSYAQLFGYVSMIFVDKLNEPDKAIVIYKDMQTKSSDERFKKVLQNKIDLIEKQKEENTQK